MNHPKAFPGLFASVSPAVSGVLKSVLRINELEKLYAEARSRDSGILTQGVLDALNIRVDVTPRDLERIPKSGPVIVVANHPFGLLDGAILDSVLARVRPDIKILTNEILCEMAEVSDRFIPVDVFAHTGADTNLRSVRKVLQALRAGQVVATFPAGEVSHWRSDQKCIADPPWSNLAARCAKSADATVVPVFFAGENSLTFQLAGLVHPRLRTVRLPTELLNKRDSTVSVRIGKPIAARDLVKLGTDEQATGYLRARVYILKYRHTGDITEMPNRQLLNLVRLSRPALIPAERPGVAAEIDRLHNEGCALLDLPTYAVYAQRGDKIPALLQEIGRLRETTFRQVGEGTGKAVDLDLFDRHYTHLILWNKERKAIVGSYRLAWTEDVLTELGISGLYTSTLFRYAPEFFDRIGHGVELGRSFIRQEYQKDYAPLMLLWQAIARCVARRPEAPVLFGPVSISASYSEAARNMIVRFLNEHSFRGDLAGLVESRRPFHSRLTGKAELRVVSECLHDVEDLPIGDIEDQEGVPILLRQYLRLGGRVAAFNVDRKFSNALDGLLIVDLRETPPKLLSKYMGTEQSASFLKHVTRSGGPPLLSERMFRRWR